MKAFFFRHPMGIGFSIITLMALCGASYGVFSPGGALSGTWNSQSVDLTATSFITGPLGFGKGGTNLASAADDTVLNSNGTAWSAAAVPNCTDTGGNHLNYTAASNAFSCGTSGSSAPGGSDTQIQYNNAGAFGGDADFTWAATTNILTTGSTGTPTTILGGAGSGANGAAITVQGGAAGSTNIGGLAKLQGGAGGGTSGNGGNAQILGGSPTDGNGGAALVTGGTAAGTNRNGGNGSVAAGSGIGSGAGGDALVTAGSAGATGAGGLARLAGGGSTTGTPGDATVQAGIAGTTGPGGNVNLTARDGVGTNQNGGNVVITIGQNTGSGTIGTFQLVGATATGAQTATFAATNKPGAGTGAPTLWWRVVVGGTTYWIPLFAN